MKKLRFLSLGLLLCAFTFPANDIKLQYTFKVGDLYEFVQSGKQSLKQTIPGAGEMTTDIQTNGTMNLKVIEVTATGAKLEAAYTRLKIVTSGSMMNMTMDSESTAEEMPSKIIKSMMNKPFSFVMTKTGKIEKVEGVENLYSGLNTLGMDEAALANAKLGFQQTINEANLKATLETGLINYPENKVKAGDSWKSASAMAMSFPLNMENTWNLKTVEGSTAAIESDATITTPDKEKVNALPNGLKSKSDLSGQQALKGKVDIKTGWPTEIKVLSEIKGKMILLAGSMVPEDMDIPMEILSESTYTIIKK